MYAMNRLKAIADATEDQTALRNCMSSWCNKVVCLFIWNTCYATKSYAKWHVFAVQIPTWCTRWPKKFNQSMQAEKKIFQALYKIPGNFRPFCEKLLFCSLLRTSHTDWFSCSFSWCDVPTKFIIGVIVPIFKKSRLNFQYSWQLGVHH